MQRTILIKDINEAVAGTFIQFTVNLADYFTPAELERGVTPKAFTYYSATVAHFKLSAVDTVGQFTVQLTANTKAAVVTDLGDGSLLAKVLVGAASDHTTPAPMTVWSEMFPANGAILPSRRRKVPQDAPYLYLGIQGLGLDCEVEGCAQIDFEL